MELLFRVKEQIIEHLTTDKKVVANSRNYLKCKFEFCEDWKGVIKTAIFTAATGDIFNVILENDACTIPYEVINYPHFTVSVFGGDLITVNRATVDVLKSGYAKGETPKEPTPDVYTQIINITKDAIKHQPMIGLNKNWFVWDIEKKEYVDTGVRAEVIISQATGDSKTEVMSQKATTEALVDLANKVAPSPASITLYANRWVQDEEDIRYHQEVVVANANITPYSKVDLQLNAEQITKFYEKDLAFVAENEDGVVTVYCIGQVPVNDYIIQATVSEVVVNG